VFNLSGGEIIVILVLALIVIGPERLPDAVRKAGRAYAELRKLSAGFQSELQDNLGEPLRAVQDTVNMMRSDFQSVVNTVANSLDPAPTPSPSAINEQPGGAPPADPVAAEPVRETAETAEASPVAEATPDAARHEGDEPS
jgi:sec-independent protein translocase protein TatB